MTKRRDFIKKSLASSAGLAIGGIGFSPKSYASIVGSNDRINVAVAGLRSRGQAHIKSFCALKDTKNVRVSTLCDADEQFFDKSIQLVMGTYDMKPATEWDMRKILDDKEIDVISFATPDHWHALGSIWACQAGKHVYVEKPCCHNIFEGRKMIEAARKYDVRLQVGFQNRSGKNMNEAMKFLHDGGIGDVYMARGLCINPRDSFGIAPDNKPPSSLHYDNWLGAAPWRQYNEKRVHYNWHWFWDTGCGDTGNQGPHQLDVARWGLRQNEHPASVYSTGGIFGIDPKECAQETPNTQSTLFKYKDGKIIEFETRGRYSNDEGSVNIRIGNIFYGTEGYLELDREAATPWRAFREREKIPFAGSKDDEKSEPEIDRTGPAGGAKKSHWGNLVDAIRAGNDEILNCDIREGHYSCSLVHLANLSYKLERELNFMGDYEKFVDDPEADTMLTRKYRPPYIVPDVV